MTARARDAATTRADLLRAAKVQFTLHGYEHTTSRDIAAAAGANVSLINRYFGSKEGLFEAVVEQAATTLTELSTDSVAGLVDQLVDGLAADAWPEHGGEHPLLLLLRGLGADDRSALLRRRVLRSITAAIAALLPAGDPTDRAVRAGTVLALFAGVLVLREVLPDEPLATVDPAALGAVLQRGAAAITGA